MRLTVIGCAGSYPGPDSPASCYLVEAEGIDDGGEPRTWRLLLDLGNGALGTLHRYADPLSIDAVFLSHLHPDHYMDLCGYYVMRKYHPTGHQPKIPVYGPPGAAERMALAYDLPLDPGMTEEFDFVTHGATPVRFGPFEIEAVPVEHPVPAFALRVTADDRVLTYTGDSGVCSGVVEAARGAHVLLAEAAFCDGEDNPEGIHLTGSDVAKAALEAGAERLVLTHIPAWHDPQVSFDEARQLWAGPLDVARSGLVIEV